MANIAITSQCNLNCSYCFTQEEYKTGAKTLVHMPLEIYREALDFVKQSDIKQIRILGGEPTLHPDFIFYMEMALKAERPVRLFSNGIMPENVLEFLSTIPDEKINIVLNITQYVKTLLEKNPRLEKTLKTLNRKIMPGLNIFHKNIRPDFLLDLIRDFDLKKQVRLGLAHPCIGYKNSFLLPKHYFVVGQRIAEFARQALEQSVKINLDCGFVPCIFNGQNMSELGLDASLGAHCEPIPDILPDGSIVPCYSLSGLDRTQLDSSVSAEAVRARFQNSITAFHETGIFKICPICDYKKDGVCTGGCVAQKIVRFNNMKNSIFVQ